ncbi:MAG: thioredoxin family protein [Saprospiraceae bacterium]
MIRTLLFLATMFVFSSCGKDEVTDNTETASLRVINSLADYDTTIKSGVSMVFFHATWCSICTAQRPSVESLTKETTLKTAILAQVDTDKNKDIIQKYNVPGQPVIIIYKDNVEKHRLLGSGHSTQKLTDLIKALL